MGMRLDEMRQLSQLGPDAREDQGLPGAHMPARGFYKIRSRNEAQREPACNCNYCGVPFWWLLHPASHDNNMNDLHHDSIESEVASTAAEDQHVVIEVKTEEDAADAPSAEEPKGG